MLASLDDAAFAHTGISLDCENFSAHGMTLVCHPGGHASSAVAGDFSNRSVRIEEANAARPLASPLEILNAVSANTAVPRTQANRDVSLVVFRYNFCLDDQKVV